VISNIGTWMQNAAAGWLMTGLNPDPLIVSLVQVATTLPMFLFGLPAGALADIVDRRRLLVGVQIGLTLSIAVFAVMVWRQSATPLTLLVFTFLTGAGSALIGPSWQAIVPQLIPREHLAPAVAANSIGFNVSRAIGPALAGFIISELGIAAPFWINALSNISVIAALIWWQPPAPGAGRLPAERFGNAILVGLRHASANLDLRASMIRAMGFFISASAYWALLPLVARDQIGGGPGLYGLLLGTIGTTAVLGAFLLPFLTHRVGADRVVVAGTLGCRGSRSLRGRQTAGGRAWGKFCGWGFLDCGHRDDQCFGSDSAPVMGARAWAFVVCHGDVRRADSGQHRMGPNGWCSWPSGHALRGRLLPRREYPAATGLEASG
jgi:MFS family permease